MRINSANPLGEPGVDENPSVIPEASPAEVLPTETQSPVEQPLVGPQPLKTPKAPDVPPVGVNKPRADEVPAPLPGEGLAQTPETPAPVAEPATIPAEGVPVNPEKIIPEESAKIAAIPTEEVSVNPAKDTAESMESKVGGSVVGGDAVIPEPGPGMMSPEQHRSLMPEKPRGRRDEIADRLSKLSIERTGLLEGLKDVANVLPRVEEIENELENLIAELRGLNDNEPPIPPQTPEVARGETN